MLNRIRRAVSLARARHFPKGRHRRALTPSQTAVATAPAPAVEPPAVPEWLPDTADRLHLLLGEDNALVRPYVLAWERQRARQRSVVVAPRLSAEAFSALAGAR
ncbi:hypothetical protein ACFYNH_11740 [Streptomyces anthocyanicus]|uniref:hypothetical protein n=1 Tax=Streptomyces anthocyanicus TaxID=68174 RepID=UPI001782531B|nr:hypothetical protein [Streptomyces anthocyanicus]WTC49850.1 hypothetical protein OG855_19775 [Streptomyces anthocyanicus]GHA33994.1 hypothetical protein GCM10010391_17470 [Streptomyces anthocyanicus]